MADQPTSDQPTSGVVKWGLAGGMLLLIILIFGVASGIFTSGSRDGDSARPPPPTSEPPVSTDGAAPTPTEASPSPTGDRSPPPAGGPPSTVEASPSSTGDDNAPDIPTLDDLAGLWAGADGTLLQIDAGGTFTLDHQSSRYRGVVRTGDHLVELAAPDQSFLGALEMKTVNTMDMATNKSGTITPLGRVA
jgi:hypothetical protein